MYLILVANLKKGKNGKYVISESCSGAEKVSKDSSLIGTSTDPENIKTTPIVCQVDCTEVVTVQYGAPVASTAGLCFEYKVKVTSRVNCGSKITTTPEPPENKYCDPSPDCHYPPPETPPGGGDDDCGPDCYGCDVNPHHDLCPDDGPNNDFDECIDKCDGGKYSLSCSNDCYNKVYGNSSLRKNSYIINNSFIATRIANIPRTDLKSDSQCANAHFTVTSDGSVIFLPDGCVAPRYKGLSDEFECVKDHTNGGGIPCTCSCSLICSWSLPSGCNPKKDYLNAGEYERDQKKNQAAYDAANKSCSSFSKCSTSQAEFSINTNYSHDGTKEDLHFPYSENRSLTSKDTAKFEDSGSVTCSNQDKYSVLFPLDESQCYQCGKKDVNGELKYSRTYMMEWGLPYVWYNGKLQTISYTSGSGYSRLKVFCLPKGIDNVNESWWKLYQIDGIKYKGTINSANDTQLEEKNGGLVDIASCSIPSESKVKNDINYNIHATSKKFGLFEWNIDIQCFFATGTSSNVCKTTEVKEDEKKKEFEVRSVTLDDLFPSTEGEKLQGSDTTGRAPGFNWTSYAINDKTTDFTSDPKSYRTWVQNNGYDVYSDEYLDYDVTLTKNDIHRLRELKKKMNGFNNIGNAETLNDGIISTNSVTNYRSTLFRGNNPILSTYKVPNENVLKCNNIKDETSCFIAGEDR